MKKLILSSAVALLLFSLMVTPALAAKPADNGFDQFGYNYKARIFNGPADGIDRKLDGKVWGSPAYANDRLVMKWNAEWDRGNDEGWQKGPYDAWENNEWNGAVPGGSGEVWHYKIVWVGPDPAAVPEGAYGIWGQFAVIMDHGTAPGAGHVFYAHASPSGYGAYP